MTRNDSINVECRNCRVFQDEEKTIIITIDIMYRALWRNHPLQVARESWENLFAEDKAIISTFPSLQVKSYQHFDAAEPKSWNFFLIMIAGPRNNNSDILVPLWKRSLVFPLSNTLLAHVEGTSTLARRARYLMS